jgi:hypothetical protein
LAAGQSYTFSVWLRSATSEVISGSVQMWALGGASNEAGTTGFTVGPEWTLISAPVSIGVSGHTSLRAQVVVNTVGPALFMDAASLSSGNARVADPGVVPVLPTPKRLMDTRPAEQHRVVDGPAPVGRRSGNTTVAVQVAGRGGIPTNATAALLNVTAVSPSGPGYVTVFPCGETVPTASNLNYSALQVIPNLVLVKLGVGADSGKVCLFTWAATDLVMDVAGYVPASSSVVPLTPARLLETRVGAGYDTVDGESKGIGKLAAGSQTELKVAGRGSVSTAATGVWLNVTAVFPSGPGYVTVFPCGETRPTASNLNYSGGEVIPNLVFVKLGVGAKAGRVCLFTYAATDLVVDVTGYAPAGSSLASLTPARLMDTRPAQQGSVVDGPAPVGQRTAGEVTPLTVDGRGGLPTAGIEGLLLNITAVSPAGAGYVAVYGCGPPEPPTVSNLNFVALQTIPNLVFVKPGAYDQVCIYTTVATHLIADVVGYVSKR